MLHGHARDIFCPGFCGDAGIKETEFAVRPAHEVAERDTHIDLLQIAGRRADITFVMLQIEVIGVSVPDNPPRLPVDGGRRQRIGIARALAMNPKFIVCDEPVSALDVSIQAQILNLLQDLQDERGLTYMFITHNLSVVKHISHSILVMYLGCEVEMCPSKELFKNPLHPYTKGLLSAIPIPSIHVQREEIIMKGEVTSPINPKPGCRFASRCPYAEAVCRETTPALRDVGEGHLAACHCLEKINASGGKTI